MSKLKPFADALVILALFFVFPFLLLAMLLIIASAGIAFWVSIPFATFEQHADGHVELMFWWEKDR